MGSIFAPPELFSAYAVAVGGTAPFPTAGLPDDPDLLPGTHLRIQAALGSSFPLTPFVVLRVKSRPTALLDLFVSGASTGGSNGFALRAGAAAEILPVARVSPYARLVRVDLDPVDARIDRAALVDARGRVVVDRDRPAWRFAGPVLDRLRVTGDGERVVVTPREVDLDDVHLDRLHSVIGLPVASASGTPSLHAWYVGVDAAKDGLARVADGAPRRLTPMDRPRGPWARVEAADEVARVVASMRVDDAFGARLARLLDDPRPPWAQLDAQGTARPGERGSQTAYGCPVDRLQLAATDPGIARYLGFAQRIDDVPTPDVDASAGAWDTLAVVGLFAFDARELARRGLVVDGTGHPADASLFTILFGALQARGAGTDLAQRLHHRILELRHAGIAVRPFLTFAAVTSPWRAPALPAPRVVDHRWQTSDGRTPSGRYRATFAFAGLPATSMASIGRVVGATATTRHREVEVPGADPARRALPILLGTAPEPAPTVAAGPAGTSSAFRRVGLLSDQDIEAAPGIATYVFAGSDLFGRFGPSVEAPLGPPPRPLPPKPSIRFSLAGAPGPVEPDGRRSPGTLVVAITQGDVGDPPFAEAAASRLGGRIVVPRLEDLPAGSLAVASIRLTFDGAARDVPIVETGFGPDVLFRLPELARGERATPVLTAQYFDTEGRPSEVASAGVPIVDTRPPPAMLVGTSLVWASAPGPGPDVEVRLRWRAAEATGYRVWLVDERGLGLAPSPAGSPPRPRCDVAQEGCRLAPGAEPGRFRLLTPSVLFAGPTGDVSFEMTLPRSLTTVQFLRIVPVGPGGAEPDFSASSVIPVAVPDGRRPTPPHLVGSVDPTTGVATLDIEARGLDHGLLAREQPGLFTPGAPGTEPPTYRLRRAIGRVADPLYAPLLGEEPLALGLGGGADAGFVARAHDGSPTGLAPFVPYVYWAEVRLPPERSLPVGVSPVPPSNGVTGVDPDARTSHPRLPSPPSAPCTLLHAPPCTLVPEVAARAAPDGAGHVKLTLEISSPPIAHRQAVDRFRLAIWAVGPTTSEPLVTRPAGGGPGVWPIVDPGTIRVRAALPAGVSAASLRLRVAYVDPLGRVGALRELTIDPA